MNKRCQVELTHQIVSMLISEVGGDEWAKKDETQGHIKDMCLCEFVWVCVSVYIFHILIIILMAIVKKITFHIRIFLHESKGFQLIYRE